MAETSRTRKLDDWFKAYMAYTWEHSSPDIYHKWSAISAVAGALQRRVWIDVPGVYKLYPNQYIVLIGPPGVMKGSAMKVGQRMLFQIPGFEFSADSISREKLISDMTTAHKNGQSALTVYCSEFSSFFSTSGPEMAVFLTDIYESQDSWSHRTKTQASQKIVNPCLNLQGCTTPETMAKSLPIHVVGLGLTSRIAFIQADAPRDRPWRQVKNPEVEKIGELLANDLHVISQLSGEYALESEMDREYDKIYRDLMQNPGKQTRDDRLRPYFSRKHTHILKVCMALAAMRRDELLITLGDLESALALLEEIEAVMGLAFSGFGASITASPMAKIVDILSALPPDQSMSYGQLLDYLKRDVRRQEFDECLDTLCAIGDIRKIMGRDGTSYFQAVD